MQKPRVGAQLSPGARSIDEQMRRGRRTNAVVYGIAGLGYVVLNTILYVQSTAIGWLPGRTYFIAWQLAWPIVMTTVLVLGREWRPAIGCYVVAGLVPVILQPADWLGVPLAWLLASGPATVYVLFFLHRKLRAVGTLVITFMLVGSLGAQATLALIATDAGMAALVFVVDVTNYSGNGTLLLAIVAVVGFAVFAVIGWWALRWIARAYQARQVSDQSMLVDALWLTFTVSQSLELANEQLGWALASLTGFVVTRPLPRSASRSRRDSPAVGRTINCCSCGCLALRSEASG